MKLLDADFTLNEIEKTLEKKLQSGDRKVRTIGDLELSYEDYKYMLLKMKRIANYMTRIEILEKYKLTMITTLVFAIRYEKDTKVVYDMITELINRFQQHQIRFLTHIFVNSFYELGISTFGINVSSINDIFELIFIHSNISKDVQDEIFHTLDEYYSHERQYMLKKELYDRIDGILFENYPFLEKGSGNNLTMTYILKDLYESCYEKHESLKQLLAHYTNLSKSLVESCYMWYLKYSKSASRLFQIR